MHLRPLRALLLLSSVAVSVPAASAVAEDAPRSSLMAEDGSFRPFMESGDTIPDFSAVGYRSGERDTRPSLGDLPAVDVAPGEAAAGRDDVARIHAAIARAAEFPLGADGYRAVVRFAPGRYELNDTVRLAVSGIVLTGPEKGEPAELHYLPKKRGVALEIGTGASARLLEDKAVKVTAPYVPVGAIRIPLADTTSFRAGDAVIVRHAFNDAWISELGMDRIPSRFMKREDGTRFDNTVQWEAKDYVYPYLRRIVAVERDAVTLDAPMVQPLDRRYGETLIGPYEHDGVIEHIGVRDLVFVSAFDASVVARDAILVDGPEEPADEQHGDWAIVVKAARQGWIHRVTGRHFVQGTVHLGEDSSHFTVSECRNLDPVSKVVGGRRYSFYITGQRHLVRDCYTRSGRHDFVGNRRVPGPNVFLDCVAEDARNGSEPHHRMAFGFLYDNVIVRGPGACLAALNRGNNGTGHGWIGAQTVFWNCASPLIIVQRPPLGQNFAIGVVENFDRTTEQFKLNLDRRLGLTNDKSGRDHTFTGGPFIGDGHFEAEDHPVSPRSLYRHQLERRRTAGASGVP